MLTRRSRSEYLEMPGLALTLRQAQRLWALDAHTCRSVLELLSESKFLRRTHQGRYVCATSATP